MFVQPGGYLCTCNDGYESADPFNVDCKRETLRNSRLRELLCFAAKDKCQSISCRPNSKCIASKSDGEAICVCNDDFIELASKECVRKPCQG